MKTGPERCPHCGAETDHVLESASRMYSCNTMFYPAYDGHAAFCEPAPECRRRQLGVLRKALERAAEEVYNTFESEQTLGVPVLKDSGFFKGKKEDVKRRLVDHWIEEGKNRG